MSFELLLFTIHQKKSTTLSNTYLCIIVLALNMKYHAVQRAFYVETLNSLYIYNEFKFRDFAIKIKILTLILIGGPWPANIWDRCE